MVKVYPVLLAGGSGTRLWPLSRKSYPKQFSKFIGDSSLFQATAKRLLSSDVVEFERHIVLTNEDYRFIVGEQLGAVAEAPGTIVIEPEPKNTAASVLAATLQVHSSDENAVILIAPSDHIIPDVRHFHEAVKTGLPHVQKGYMAAFGVQPTHPETGYGYLKLSPERLDRSGTAILDKFIEKPNAETAKLMLAAGDFLWNSGILLFRAQDMIDAFQVHAPETLELVTKSLNEAISDLDFLRLSKHPWSLLENISIDYAIMEKAADLISVPYNSKWSDLGDWQAVWSEEQKDLSGTAVSENALAIDCQNTLLRSVSGNQSVVGIGLENIIVIAMNDAVLVADKSLSQEVKKAVEILDDKNVSQAKTFPIDYRPWGYFESLVIGDRFQVKRICVNSGAALSLQSHKYRSEHWVVVSGNARVTIDHEVKSLSEGESVFVPLGAIHRVENPGSSLLILIEVQIGSYLGEDDIIRYEDVYKRL